VKGLNVFNWQQNCGNPKYDYFDLNSQSSPVDVTKLFDVTKDGEYDVTLSAYNAFQPLANSNAYICVQ